jgi:uncharacterized delta-60 repeat protein
MRLALTAAVSAALMTTSVAAASGPDPGFGTDGKVVTTFPDRSSSIAALALQRDGKILASGLAWNAETEVSSLVVARYGADGKLDVGFGTNGVTAASGNWPSSIAVQGDGRILVGGSGLTRYLANGRPDATFGRDGHVATRFVVARVLAGRKWITAVGTRGGGPNSTLYLARYRLDGTLDRGFGTRGLVTRARFWTAAAAPTSGGKIVVSSTRLLIDCEQGCVDPPVEIRLARFLPTGRLDRTFGGDGIVAWRALPRSGGFRSLAVQPDGKILVGGYGGGFHLVRFRADGSLDTSFGQEGVVVEAIGAGIRALAVDPAGNIVAAGSSSDLEDFVVARFCGRPCGPYAAGHLDPAFGAVVTDFGARENPWAVAVQPDGAILAAGETGRSLLTDVDFALARYR